MLLAFCLVLVLSLNYANIVATEDGAITEKFYNTENTEDTFNNVQKSLITRQRNSNLYTPSWQMKRFRNISVNKSNPKSAPANFLNRNQNNVTSLNSNKILDDNTILKEHIKPLNNKNYNVLRLQRSPSRNKRKNRRYFQNSSTWADKQRIPLNWIKYNKQASGNQSNLMKRKNLRKSSSDKGNRARQSKTHTNRKQPKNTKKEHRKGRLNTANNRSKQRIGDVHNLHNSTFKKPRISTVDGKPDTIQQSVNATTKLDSNTGTADKESDNNNLGSSTTSEPLTRMLKADAASAKGSFVFRKVNKSSVDKNVDEELSDTNNTSKTDNRLSTQDNTTNCVDANKNEMKSGKKSKPTELRSNDAKDAENVLQGITESSPESVVEDTLKHGKRVKQYSFFPRIKPNYRNVTEYNATKISQTRTVKTSTGQQVKQKIINVIERSFTATKLSSKNSTVSTNNAQP